MLLFIILLYFCSLVCFVVHEFVFVVVHELFFASVVLFLFISLCCCSLVCFVVLHVFGFANAVVY